MPSPAAAEALADAFALESAGRWRDALARFEHATVIDPECGRLWRHRGNLLRRVGELGAAGECFERAMAQGDDRSLNAFFLSAIGIGPVVPVAPDGFVSDLFDQYAGRFDDHLVGKLAYRAPAALAEAVQPGEGRSRFDTAVDLGCGTGLAGAAFRPRCRTLIGVDLSARMLEQARQRGIYDELVRSEMVAALQARAERVDLVLCCDALIYVGDLDPLFRAVGRVLCAGGSWAFTVETGHAIAGFDLLPALRYCHSEAYLRRLAATHGFAVRALRVTVLRAEAGEPVDGQVVHMVRTGTRPI